MKLSDMGTGDVFKEMRGGRWCTIRESEVEGGGLVIVSLSDGWMGRVDQFKDLEVRPTVGMPRTPLELIQFIREHQVRDN